MRGLRPGPYDEAMDPHNSFEHHVIKRRDERSLLLQRPGREAPFLWCTIAIDDHGQIVVFGDFGPMVFGTHPGSLEERIAWMGSHPEVDSYVVEKANIGMSNFRRAMTVATAEDFEADVREIFAERVGELDDEGESFDKEDFEQKRKALTWEAFEEQLLEDELEMIEGTVVPAQQELDAYLTGLGSEDHWEWIGKIGCRPVREVGLAHAALRRAHVLLVDEECARIEAMTEEELRADCIARGTTLEVEARHARGIIAKAIQSVRDQEA